MTRAIRALGDRMLTRLLPQAQAKACHCCWISYQCWLNPATGCTGCNYAPGSPTCGCSGHVCGFC